MTVVLEGMSPAQEQGWLVLLDLFPNRRSDWTLIGGQMMYILAAENGVTMPRTTTDMDVVINVVESPGAIRALASQLLQRGFEFGDVSPAGTGGRFTKPADPGPGSIMFDVLAPRGSVSAQTSPRCRRQGRSRYPARVKLLIGRSWSPFGFAGPRGSCGDRVFWEHSWPRPQQRQSQCDPIRSEIGRTLRSCYRWFPTRLQHAPNAGERTSAASRNSAPCSPMTIAPGGRWVTRNVAWAGSPFGCCSTDRPRRG